MSLLPIFLKLDGRRGLLVGAGTVALDKVGSLLKTGLLLRVVAPKARPEIRALAAAGKLEWVQRAFAPEDLDGNFVVIAATDVAEVNAAVYRGCVERGIVCNSVDDIPNCDFFFGSVVTRGDLQIAISTAGESPALAQRLRREIDAQLPDDLGLWLSNLGELRREVLDIHPRGDERRALLHQLASRSVCESETCPSRMLARKPLASHPVEIDNATETALSSTREGKVFLVGAGPGDPDLLTVKALRLIQSANVILHDDLVPQAILSLAPHAEIVNVGKRCGMKSITQQEISALMVEHAQAGRSLVRLKSGDPLIFGRAAEEMSALRDADVAFEVVPGITSAFAAAAAIPASLTDRHNASHVIFSSGHHAQSHNDAALPALEDATRVVYMPGRDLTLLAAEWRAEGLPAELPCVLVSHAGQPAQEVFATTLDELGDAPPMQAPSLLLAGWSLRNTSIIKEPTSIGVAAD
jgi:uroporphyrin-III C-methyltransferase